MPRRRIPSSHLPPNTTLQSADILYNFDSKEFTLRHILWLEGRCGFLILDAQKIQADVAWADLLQLALSHAKMMQCWCQGKAHDREWGLFPFWKIFSIIKYTMLVVMTSDELHSFVELWPFFIWNKKPLKCSKAQGFTKIAGHKKSLKKAANFSAGFLFLSQSNSVF